MSQVNLNDNNCTDFSVVRSVKGNNNEKQFYLLTSNDLYGRYLVTAKDIKAGEIIFQDRPVVVGPAAESSLVCFGCYRSLQPPIKYITCPQCHVVPFCNSKCAETFGDHTKLECTTFSAAVSSTLTPTNFLRHLQIVMPLRCLLLKNTNRTAWEELFQLESHIDKRKGTGIWKIHQELIIDVLYKWNLVPEGMSAEQLHHVTGILDVNSFEIRAPVAGNLGDIPNDPGNCIRGLFLKAALMAHDCVGNTHLAVDDKFTLTVRSSVDLKQGTPIYFNYTNTLKNTSERQEHLREGKYFDCMCARCSDRTELGIHMSSLLCPKCTGYVTVNYVGAAKDCKCETCGKIYHEIMFTQTLKQAEDQIKTLDKTNYKEGESLLKKLSLSLSPNHSLMIDLKQSLIATYRDVLRVNQKPNKYVLERKYELCRDLLPILEKVEPGISRLRGIALYEMHIPLVVLANREYEARNITAEELLEKLLEANHIVRDAVRLLLYEPQASPEGRLAKQALHELKMISDNIANVRNIITVTANISNKKLKGKKYR